ncbi:MAG TPA: SpoIIE family protein phosphatase [Anaerolineaceae bacterium]|nr:SpoIIE family protein phosphatase [Anaerolineaceae bacterium]
MNRQRILIVDDEPFNVDYLEQELEDADCEIFTASNGEEAIEQVRAHDPDLILLDIMMPVMDGFSVLKQLKAEAETREIPVIVISASSEMQSVVKGIRLGAEDYLPKPFDPTLLHARVAASLEKKRLRDVEVLYLKSLEREFEIAREIQSSFLPSSLPELAGYEVAALFKAAREVAGDFYDAFTLPDGNLVFVVGDVCGKGVGAALFMTLFRSLIRATATSDVYCSTEELTGMSLSNRLQHVVSFTNHYVTQTHGDANMFATLVAGLIEVHSGMLYYANCGNPAPIVFRGGEHIASLAPTGPVIGVMDEAQFLVKEMQLLPGDILLVFSDGVTDFVDPEGDFLGEKPFLALINHQAETAGDLLQSIQIELEKYSSGAKQFDDITLVAVRRGD